MRDYLRGRRPRGGVGSSPSTTKIVVLVAILVILVVAGVALYLKSKTELVRTDPKTLCPTNRPLSEVIVLLLDMSDEFSEPQRLKIENEFDRLKDSMDRFGLIEAYAVDRLQQRVTSPVVQLCKPLTEADIAHMNEIYQNPDLARKKWGGFVRQLHEELQRLMATPQSATSAIFEAVQATALRTFNRPEYDGLPKRLIIVSDLLQNVPKYSQYNGVQPFKDFKRSPYYSEVHADLKGVSITVLYLVRPHAPQKWPDHYRFWEEYFHDQGATVERVEPVYGAR